MTTDNSERQVAAWQEQTYRLYLTSIIAWGVATFALCIKFFTSGMVLVFNLSTPANAIFLMLLALPGLSYFLWQSIKLREETDPRQAQAIFNRIMWVQHPTGIAGMIGGVLGLLPFIVNFVGFLTAKPSDMWFNLGMILPWVSLYGFITTYIIALVLNKRRKKPQP